LRLVDLEGSAELFFRLLGLEASINVSVLSEDSLDVSAFLEASLDASASPFLRMWCAARRGKDASNAVPQKRR